LFAIFSGCVKNTMSQGFADLRNALGENHPLVVSEGGLMLEKVGEIFSSAYSNVEATVWIAVTMGWNGVSTEDRRTEVLPNDVTRDLHQLLHLFVKKVDDSDEDDSDEDDSDEDDSDEKVRDTKLELVEHNDLPHHIRQYFQWNEEVYRTLLNLIRNSNNYRDDDKSDWKSHILNLVTFRDLIQYFAYDAGRRGWTIEYLNEVLKTIQDTVPQMLDAKKEKAERNRDVGMSYLRGQYNKFVPKMNELLSVYRESHATTPGGVGKHLVLLCHEKKRENERQIAVNGEEPINLPNDIDQALKTISSTISNNDAFQRAYFMFLHKVIGEKESLYSWMHNRFQGCYEEQSIPKFFKTGDSGNQNLSYSHLRGNWCAPGCFWGLHRSVGLGKMKSVSYHAGFDPHGIRRLKGISLFLVRLAQYHFLEDDATVWFPFLPTVLEDLEKEHELVLRHYDVRILSKDEAESAGNSLEKANRKMSEATKKEKKFHIEKRYHTSCWASEWGTKNYRVAAWSDASVKDILLKYGADPIKAADLHWFELKLRATETPTGETPTGPRHFVFSNSTPPERSQAPRLTSCFEYPKFTGKNAKKRRNWTTCQVLDGVQQPNVLDLGAFGHILNLGMGQEAEIDKLSTAFFNGLKKRLTKASNSITEKDGNEFVTAYQRFITTSVRLLEPENRLFSGIAMELVCSFVLDAEACAHKLDYSPLYCVLAHSTGLLKGLSNVVERRSENALAAAKCLWTLIVTGIGKNKDLIKGEETDLSGKEEFELRLTNVVIDILVRRPSVSILDRLPCRGNATDEQDEFAKMCEKIANEMFRVILARTALHKPLWVSDLLKAIQCCSARAARHAIHRFVIGQEFKGRFTKAIKAEVSSGDADALQLERKMKRLKQLEQAFSYFVPKRQQEELKEAFKHQQEEHEQVDGETEEDAEGDEVDDQELDQTGEENSVRVGTDPRVIPPSPAEKGGSDKTSN
jgi:hypothetical protein